MQVVINRTTVIGGVKRSPGDRIDLSHLPSHKISQLLDQRVIRPADPASLDEKEAVK